MPVVFQNPLYPYQVSFGGQQAASTQSNYREMLSEVTQWNPDLDPNVAGRFINNYYRKVIDRRSWYGLKLRGYAYVYQPINSGRVTVVQGNPQVIGNGTTWSTAPAGLPGSLVGLQFRTSFTNAYQTIVNVSGPTSLQLDTPYAAQSLTLTGYQIVSAYLNFGANIKRMLWASNQQMGWPMEVNVPVQTINNWDIWRTSLGWSNIFATRSPAPDGSMIVECWPTPFSNQTFPFEAYQQPANLEKDDDSFVAWIPTDLIVKRACADAAMFAKKNSPYYKPELAAMMIREFNERVEEAERSDNNIDQQDVTWDYGQEDGRVGFGPGSTWQQMHD